MSKQTNPNTTDVTRLTLQQKVELATKAEAQARALIQAAAKAEPEAELAPEVKAKLEARRKELGTMKADQLIELVLNAEFKVKKQRGQNVGKAIIAVLSDEQCKYLTSGDVARLCVEILGSNTTSGAVSCYPSRNVELMPVQKGGKGKFVPRVKLF